VAVTANHLETAGHVPSAARRLAMNQMGLWLFFFSESFLFSALATARFYLDGTHVPDHLNQVLGLVITSVLLLSSLTAYNTEAAIAAGNRTAFKRNLLATIALGLVFVVGVAIEWSTADFGLSEPYGTAFFSMTGLHTSHVVSGIVMLAILYWLAIRGHFSPKEHWGVEAVIKYWHFVDVVWVFFYPTLYLVSWT
jgi:cytochrome c oxidase subunit 3